MLLNKDDVYVYFCNLLNKHNKFTGLWLFSVITDETDKVQNIPPSVKQAVSEVISHVINAFSSTRYWNRLLQSQDIVHVLFAHSLSN